MGGYTKRGMAWIIHAQVDVPSQKSTQNRKESLVIHLTKHSLEVPLSDLLTPTCTEHVTGQDRQTCIHTHACSHYPKPLLTLGELPASAHTKASLVQGGLAARMFSDYPRNVPLC